MNEICPICSQHAQSEKIYESKQGYTNTVGKFAVKQGGKYVGKTIGSFAGSFVGMPEVGGIVGGLIGSYATGVGLDEYANRQGPFHYHYNCKHCSLEWNSTDNEMSIVNNYYMVQHRYAKHPWVNMLIILVIPYGALLALLILSGVFYVATLSLINFTGWAWNLACVYASYTWIAYLILMFISICHEPFIKKHRTKQHINGVCNRFGVSHKTIVFPNGSYDGTVDKSGVPHGYGIYTWGSGAYYEGTFINGKMEGYGMLYNSKYINYGNKRPQDIMA